MKHQEIVRFAPGQREVAVPQKPSRVWTTLFGLQELPVTPVHGRGFFLEDEIHDWSWRDGRLRYFSRVTSLNEARWVLLEYKE